MLRFILTTYFLAFFLMAINPQIAFSQTKVSGKISDEETGEPLIGVNIFIKGTVSGTVTNIKGEFLLSTNTPPPFILVFSSIGFQSQELEVSGESLDLNVKLLTQVLLGQEVVVSATRVEESILESPVTIEKMDIMAIQNSSGDDYYKSIYQLKGVDMAQSSINFQIINSRGFGSTGNTRFIQQTDGMDTQAPALNFPIGNLNGPTVLDVESVELIPGAQSALYGPNAFNGILMVNSKSPFEYQGLSAMVKMGVNHVGGNANQSTAPTYQGAIRYAKTFKNRFAFKINLSYSAADDWWGTDYTDRNIGITPEGFSFNPGTDALHKQGDEATLNMSLLRLSSGWQTLATTDDPYFSGQFAPGLTAWSYADAGDLPSQVYTPTPWEEQNMVDYDAWNAKANVGLGYRINEKMELSYQFNGGWGTSVYTGAQRYSLNNFNIQQHRLQLKGDNYFIRAYSTVENSGDSYIAEFLGKRIHDLEVNQFRAPDFGGISRWFGDYAIQYLRSLNDLGLAPGEINSLTDAELVTKTGMTRTEIQEAGHVKARADVDGLYRVEAGTPEFEKLKEEALKGVVPEGPKFDDKSALYHVEGQYDLAKHVNGLDGLLIGGNFRQFLLRSNGTLFDDRPNGISINEFGAYAQLTQNMFNQKFKFSASLRYDKNENFEGQFSPRVSGVYRVAKNHNIRASYQTGFRIPTTQGQFIDLDIISARLLGGLNWANEKYNLTQNAFTGPSVAAYSNAVFDQGSTGQAINDSANLALLIPFTTWKEVKPERVKSFEIGYKSLVNNRLLIDVAYYFSWYTDFISQVRIRQAEFLEDSAGNPTGQLNYATLLNGTSENSYQYYTNVESGVSAHGLVFGISYNFNKGYVLGGNYNFNQLREDLSAQGFLSEFNTPENKFNLSFSNRKLTKKLGFGINYRWQDAFLWESSFAVGNVPQYYSLDAFITYSVPRTKTTIKLGASNLTNNKYFQSKGGPDVMGIYYITITYDDLMR
jgi:iron complex outermembrane recepter protein